MTRTEKWKEKREQIKEDSELEVLKKIKMICRNNKVCDMCKYAKEKHECIFAVSPHLWALENERQLQENYDRRTSTQNRHTGCVRKTIG